MITCFNTLFSFSRNNNYKLLVYIAAVKERTDLRIECRAMIYCKLTTLSYSLVLLHKRCNRKSWVTPCSYHPACPQPNFKLARKAIICLQQLWGCSRKSHLSPAVTGHARKESYIQLRMHNCMLIMNDGSFGIQFSSLFMAWNFYIANSSRDD